MTSSGVAVRKIRSVTVCVQHNNCQLHIPGDNRGDGGTLHPQGRGAQMAENQDPVAEKVCQNRADSREHGRTGFTGFPQRTGINLHQREGRQPPQHDVQIVAAAPEREIQIPSVAFPLQEGRDKAFPEKQVDQHRGRADQHTEIHLEPESMAHAVHVALAKELGAVDAGTAHAAEYSQGEYHHDLIGNGSSGNRLCSETADHDIVQQGHERGDELLDDDRN